MILLVLGKHFGIIFDHFEKVAKIDAKMMPKWFQNRSKIHPKSKQKSIKKPMRNLRSKTRPGNPGTPPRDPPGTPPGTGRPMGRGRFFTLIIISSRLVVACLPFACLGVCVSSRQVSSRSSLLSHFSIRKYSQPDHKASERWRFTHRLEPSHFRM